MNHPRAAQYDRFVDRVKKRLERGHAEYGDRSFERDDGNLLGEIQEEIEDVAGWAWILWCRMEDIKRRRQRGDQ